MNLKKEQLKLIAQLLGNRIVELQKKIGLDNEFGIKPKNHKYLVKELEVAENFLDEIIDKKSRINKSKTAVDWLIDNIVYSGEVDYTSYSVFLNEHVNRLEVFNKAKNIERENIEAAYECGFHDGAVLHQLSNLPEQYYEDNYNDINYIDEPIKQNSEGKNI